VLLGYGAISTLFNTITFLFGPGETGSTFSQRAVGTVHVLDGPLIVAALVGAVVLAHVGTHLKLAKLMSLVALASLGVAVLFGVVALFSTFGADSAFITGWSKTVGFFVGLAELAIAGVGGWLVLGYFQQHGPARPVQPFGQPPAGQWQQQPQQQWQPPQTGAPVPQPWGPPPAGAPQQPIPPQQQPWGAPQPPQGGQQGAPQGAFNPADSMATQAIPAMPQQPQQPQQGQQQGVPPQHQAQQQHQPAPETQSFPPIGNWTSEG
jgi:hypothetical protein